MSFWQGKRVLVTGHTGFKGAWLAEWLLKKGASVAGLALKPDTEPSLFVQLGLATRLDHAFGDMRDRALVAARVDQVRPEIVFHLAAQPLVRRSYAQPVETWATNVLGTVHLLDALTRTGAPCVLVVVTTDKVYANREWVHAYRETDELGGHDPYSASKAAAELAVDSWRKSFGREDRLRVATARAGNVIGGGDWSEDRIVPDFVRAQARGTALEVRHPTALRPWQHVLDPLNGYLILAERLAASGDARGYDAFNFGPDTADLSSVSRLLELASVGSTRQWTARPAPVDLHEAGRLALATDKARALLAWSPRWGLERAVGETIGWYRKVGAGADAREMTRDQIDQFESAS